MVTATSTTIAGGFAPPPVTHQRYTSVTAPRFRECCELSGSGDARRYLACAGAEVSFVPAPNSHATVIQVECGSIILLRRIENGKTVRFQLDIPHPAPHFDGEFTVE